MKAIRLDLGSAIAKAGDAEEAVVSSLTAYIRFCPNLHTVKLEIANDTLWILRQLPDVLSGLVSPRRIAFWLLTEAEADVTLLGDNAKTWTTLDENLGDRAKFKSLEHVEVLCRTVEKEEVPFWWEIDTGSRGHGESDSGRESDGEDGEVECREENLRGETCEVEMTYDLANLRPTMNRVAMFHRHKKSLTDLFPRLSKRGVLWCGIGNHNIYSTGTSIPVDSLSEPQARSQSIVGLSHGPSPLPFDTPPPSLKFDTNRAQRMRYLGDDHGLRSDYGVCRLQSDFSLSLVISHPKHETHTQSVNRSEFIMPSQSTTLFLNAFTHLYP
ncbi:hypothetical protein NLI96_g8594 [Meripilus lineatus]|uniref:Uncharacterized protein n=1 Tax=Meripilus lineatus TaxID=2056292 RepID=A0AAD5UWZ8_9APHY|nr:hypothetical protein NLI96_g8594 [Physisporinus lineatus]